jgi:hypothetical protein
MRVGVAAQSINLVRTSKMKLTARLTPIMLFLMVSIYVMPVGAQVPAPDDRSLKNGQSQPDEQRQPPREQQDRQFAQNRPRMGETLPDVVGYDEQGTEVHIASFSGKPTVIVFGCLT